MRETGAASGLASVSDEEYDSALSPSGADPSLAVQADGAWQFRHGYLQLNSRPVRVAGADRRAVWNKTYV